MHKFDPEGIGYDYQTAKSKRLKRKNGHWPSLDPESGMILKGMKHPTIRKTFKIEQELGRGIVKRKGRYYSIK